MKKILFIIILSLFSVVSYAQNSHSDFFQLIHRGNNVNTKYFAVDIIDSASKEVIRRFNLSEENPYNQLGFTLHPDKINEENNKTYVITSTPVYKIELPNDKLALRQNFDAFLSKDELICESYYQVTFLEKKFVVKYDFFVTSEETVIGRSSTVLIINNQGNIENKLNGFDTDVREWAITQNGNYFSYAFGGIYDEWSGSFVQPGYGVIDLTCGETIVKEFIDQKYNDVRTGSKENLIIITAFISWDCLYVFLDIDSNKRYSRVFSGNEIGLWKEVTTKGVVLYKDNRKSNSSVLLSFENDFIMEDLR